ncbi:MAG: hypothetical protein JNK82_15685 [Myxococcaceae bacterium]|nr:hypothetical protein [Myxococcaceae bacterium]
MRWALAVLVVGCSPQLPCRWAGEFSGAVDCALDSSVLAEGQARLKIVTPGRSEPLSGRSVTAVAQVPGTPSLGVSQLPVQSVLWDASFRGAGCGVEVWAGGEPLFPRGHARDTAMADPTQGCELTIVSLEPLHGALRVQLVGQGFSAGFIAEF